MPASAGFSLALAAAVCVGVLLWRARQAGSEGSAGLRGSWSWNDSSIFEFQKIDFRFTADSFFLAQKFIDPRKPSAMMPCAQADHWVHAAGLYFLAGDTLRFKGGFTDRFFSRDTLRLCRDTGFKGSSHFILQKDTLWLQAPGSRKNVRLARAASKR